MMVVLLVVLIELKILLLLYETFIIIDEISFLDVNINLPSVKRTAELLGTRRTVKKQWQAAWLLKAVTCIDLTTLSGNYKRIHNYKKVLFSNAF